MNRLHLYSAFRLAGALLPIRCQREPQAELLRPQAPRSLLTVRSAYGEELHRLLAAADMTDPRLMVTAVDLCDVERELRAHRFAIDLGPRLRWVQIDLFDFGAASGYGRFDVLQCSFVPHDILSNAKDRAMQALAGASRPQGYLPISQILVRRSPEYASEIAQVHDAFLRETEERVQWGRLNDHGRRLLVGDGASPGLLRSKHDALHGGRDFFETLEDTVRNAGRCGLQIKRVVPNTCNDRLFIFLFQRPAMVVTDPGVATTGGVKNVQ